MKKFRLFSRIIDYLGHTILTGELLSATEPTKSIEKTPFRDEEPRLQSGLGACNVYRRFIRKFAGIERPLNAIILKDTEVKWENPSEEPLKAFRYLKKSLENPPILGNPKTGGRYMVEKDAIKYDLGTVMLQQ